MNSIIFCNMVLCRLVEMYIYFGGNHRLRKGGDLLTDYTALIPLGLFHNHCHENLRSHTVQKYLVSFSSETVTNPFLPLNTKGTRI
jgi:hypothetical protein